MHEAGRRLEEGKADAEEKQRLLDMANSEIVELRERVAILTKANVSRDAALKSAGEELMASAAEREAVVDVLRNSLSVETRKNQELTVMMNETEQFSCLRVEGLQRSLNRAEEKAARLEGLLHAARGDNADLQHVLGVREVEILLLQENLVKAKAERGEFEKACAGEIKQIRRLLALKDEAMAQSALGNEKGLKTLLELFSRSLGEKDGEMVDLQKRIEKSHAENGRMDGQSENLGRMLAERDSEVRGLKDSLSDWYVCINIFLQ